ncbi:ABC transporter ATP-binding protein [Arenibacterium sp. LLYu02]|uniref:ABC transporter ATP-binding protein n=1 Tax=Arenibacterium sp. LLYu02 TaxID=3404132 RepID=UPI003B20D7F8
MSTVHLSHVVKQFGAHRIIKDLSAEFQDGEFTALVGPSGCGKSTLLRMIAGLETLSGGTIDIAGTRVNQLEPRDRGVAMVFQSYALYPHMKVADNMSFALQLARAASFEIQSRLSHAADILGLAALMDRYPRQLSGGQRQRVAMGRAIVRQPKVFLFDEPLSNLDAKLRVKMRSEIKALHNRLGSTSIYVTHDQIEAMTMADRIVVMRDGHIEQVGSPMELYARPKNTFVAGFIGSPAMTLLPGRVVEGAVQTATGLRLPLPEGSPVAAGQAVIYGIRPEHIHISDGGLRLPVVQMELTGAETLITCGQGEELILCSQRGFPPEVGAEGLSLVFDPAQIHLFDQSSGVRL